MNWRWHKRASVYLMRVVTVMLVAAWVGGFLLLFYQDHVSAAGNESVTRQFSPSANASVTIDAGDNDGFETTAANAYADDASYAEDTNSGLNDNVDPIGIGTDKHNYYTYGLLNAVPAGSTISGITVQADIAVSTTKDAPFTAIRLSWDGGTTWTDPVKQFTLTAEAETTYTYGGTTDLWGRTWSTSELSDANFRVQVINGETKGNVSSHDFSLDWIPVSVTFTAPWESYENLTPTVCDDFTESNNHVYMQGTGFPTGSYTVGYFDGSGIWIADDDISVSGDGILNSEYQLDSLPADFGTWHALAQPTGATSFPGTYAIAIAAPDTYELLADDSFNVEASAIPEFPTVMAGIMVAGLCFGIYYWMRKRRLAYVKA